MLENLKYEINVIKENDPAARNWLEILLLYSGFKAVRSYRVAHRLHKKGLRFLKSFFDILVRRKLL